MFDLPKLKAQIGYLKVEDDPTSENLAVVLCCYFESHIARPIDDENAEENDCGWTPWVSEQADNALDLIVKQAVELYLKPEPWRNPLFSNDK